MEMLRLEELHIPRLRELRGYGDFWWDIPLRPTDPSFPALERLKCNFEDAQSFRTCVSSCPSLLFLNAELSECPGLHPSAAATSETGLAPRLSEAILDRMTPQWESLLSL
ncbi:hypothetical protein AURDEDRAFT_175983 [Auricularia subglabra TFB-10046 SS5]|nr:hypothetical protein AURDEDRAFT_175983 [Auricularia subglabra TFB-10046 SS5]